MASLPPSLDFEFFALQEDDPIVRAWLARYGFAAEFVMGYGSLLWLEHCELISKMLLPGHAGAEAVAVRTLDLWGPASW